MVRIKALEIYSVSQTEGKREIPEIGGDIASIITFCLPFCPAFTFATADLQGSFSICNHPAPPA